MTMKFRNFDWEGIGMGVVIALFISLPTFVAAWLAYQMGLTNFYEQTTVMGNYTEYTLPINIEAYYEAMAWQLGAIYSGILTLIVFCSILIFFIVLCIIDAIHIE